jgi:hypothetical protein
MAKSEHSEHLLSLRDRLGVAADLEPPTDEEWSKLIGALDRPRGLFRSRDGAKWDLHPRTLWAVACRIGRYIPQPLVPEEYGRPPRGTSGGRWVRQRTGNLLELRASLLTSAAAEIDPPTLRYPYDFSDDAPEPPLADLLAEVRSELQLPDDEHGTTLAIRHDVDRPLETEDLEAHLELEDELGLTSTWFFKRETFDPRKAEVLVDRDREIGYHAEILSTGDDGFVQQLRDYLGIAPGLTFHGGLGSQGWRGKRSFDEAMDLDVAYAEFPAGVRRTPVLWPAGSKTWLRLAPLPIKPDVFPERVTTHIDTLGESPAMIVVENHPDLLESAYRQLLLDLVERSSRSSTVGSALVELLPDYTGETSR